MCIQLPRPECAIWVFLCGTGSRADEYHPGARVCDARCHRDALFLPCAPCASFLAHRWQHCGNLQPSWSESGHDGIFAHARRLDGDERFERPRAARAGSEVAASQCRRHARPRSELRVPKLTRRRCLRPTNGNRWCVARRGSKSCRSASARKEARVSTRRRSGPS